MILLLYTAYVVTGAMCGGEKQNNEHGTNLNVTTLYPIQNNLIHSNENSNSNNNIKSKSEDRSGGENKEVSSMEDNLNKETSKKFDKTLLREDDTIIIKHDIENGIHSNANDNEKGKLKVPKLDMANWKIDTAFTHSKLEKSEDVSDKNKKDSDSRTLQDTGQEFKPSPQLGNFYDEDAFVLPTQESIGSFSPLNNPSSFFSNTPEDFYKLNYKPPISYSNPIDTLYKFENTVSRDKDRKYNSGGEPKPTAEAPVKIPAGGLYKLPDPFKEKPSTDGDDDNFGLDFNDEEKDVKENPVKKRGNPWKSVLHLVTALIPVGIILSALTPNIITLESADINPHYPNRYSRRSGDVAALPPVSENCKRRLLCEIHSDTNYNMQSTRKQRHCYKIQCDDPQALSKVLHWLLLYNRSRGLRPAEHDRRGFIVT